MDPVERLQPFFDAGGVVVQRVGHHGGVELVAFDAGGRQKLAVVRAQPVEFPLNHAADRQRQLLLKIGDGPRQRPAAGRFGQVPRSHRSRSKSAMNSAFPSVRA